MTTLRNLLTCLLLSLALVSAFSADADAQTGRRRSRRYHVDVYDSLPITNDIPTVVITARARTAEERRAYLRRVQNHERLRIYVRKLYPLACEVARLVKQVNADLANVTDKDERRKYIRKLEKQLFAKYEPTIREMTRTQGRILILLIYRQSGNSAYGLVEELRSEGTASFWQLISKIYGLDLKEQYDKSKFPAIEMIVQQIENNEPDEVTIRTYE